MLLILKQGKSRKSPDEDQLYSGRNVAINTYATQSWDKRLILFFHFKPPFKTLWSFFFIPTSLCLFPPLLLFSLKGVTCPAMTMKSEGLIVSPPICSNSSAVLGYATECHFKCKDGYRLQGPGLKTCAESKSWIPIGNPSCRGVCLLWSGYY